MHFLFKNLRRYDFYNFYFYRLRIAGIVELELLTSLKTILFQLTEIEWSFEMLYFFFLLEVCK